MATLVLTAVGTIVGGPIGGAVGALIGQQVDQRLFAPKGRQGPRLGELSVQVSRYGQPIPKLFGTMRVAGSVVWATDLIEDRHKSGGGKGRPKTTTYSYSVSFAVALSARPIRAVHRIWADGKLLRGAAGDWKAETGFRLYLGDEEQPVDPLIAAVEGIGNAPAFRGLAYAVFEHMELADFANHIPSLTFEVEADDGDVAVHDIFAELSGAAITGMASLSLGGFAASGDSVRGMIEALGRSIGLSFQDDGAALRLIDPAPTPILVGGDQLGSSADARTRAKTDIGRAASGALPDEVAISYYEPARDFQTGLQRARRGGPGRRVEQIELSAAVDADAAKAIAEHRLADSWAQRTRRTVTLPWRALDLRAGDHVQIAGTADRWRVGEMLFEKMAIELKLLGVPPLPGDASLPAEPGRATGSEDVPHGATVLHLLDIPSIEDGALAAPRLWIVAAGTSPGWRRAGLIASSDGGLSYGELGATAAPAVMGVALNALAAGAAGLFDEINKLEVALLHDAMAIEGRSDDALIGGANLALLGDELIQYGRVEQIGVNQFRLTRLTRGRRGTEWAMAGHAIGDRFVLIEAESLLAHDLPVAKIGAEISVIASGIGDSGGVEASLVLNGRSVRPPPPVHLTMERLGDGTMRFGWVRRSRLGWGWTDGADVPIGEEAERYRLEIMPSTGLPRTVELVVPTYDYGPAEQAADGSGAASAVTISVSQIGSLAASLPAAIRDFTL